MTDLAPASRLIRKGERASRRAPSDSVLLDYEGRFLRRKRLTTEAGDSVLVDLPETASLEDGDCLELGDGTLIEIVAAEEPVLLVSGNLPRLAWHIGNRHTPCQIEGAYLVIRQDHVLEDMLRGLGATVARGQAAFNPEGGAYGHGRTMGHDHGHEAGHEHRRVHHHSSHEPPADESERAAEADV